MDVGAAPQWTAVAAPGSWGVTDNAAALTGLPTAFIQSDQPYRPHPHLRVLECEEIKLGVKIEMFLLRNVLDIVT